MNRRTSRRSAPVRKIHLKVNTRFEGRKVIASVAVLGEPELALGGSIELELFQYHTQKVVCRRKFRHLLPGFKQERVFPLKGVPPGNCWFRGVFTDRYGQRAEVEVIHDKAAPSPWWLGSKMGLRRGVPAPWTPLRTVETTKGVSLECWGRKYGFDRRSLVSRIETAGSSVLAGPVRLVGKANRRKISWTRASLQLVGRENDASVFVQQFRDRGLTADVRTEVTFDGMIRLDWRLSTEKACRLDALTLEIPLRARHAKYLYQFPGKWQSAQNARELPADGLVTSFRPFIWLGDEDRGLAWFCESDENWFGRDPERVTEILRRRDTVIVRLHLVSAPIALLPAEGKSSGTMTGLGTDASAPQARGLRYTMGLQATPIKPVEKDAWDYRLFCIGIETAKNEDTAPLDIPSSLLDQLAASGIRTVVIFEYWSDAEAYAETRYGPQLKRVVKACHDRGLRVLLYFGFLISDLAPEWPQLGKECLVMPKGGYPVYHYRPQPGQSAWKVCLRSVWQDLVVAGVARVMDEFDVDGVYLDGTEYPFGCCNTLHGCGTLKPDGQIAPTDPIFAVRNAMQRIYQVVKSRKPDGQINIHNSTCMTIPTLGWATSYWDGEQFGQFLSPGGRRGRMPMPLDAFRTEFMGHQWGVPAEFLCNSQPFTFNYRQAWSFCLLHDVPVRPFRRKSDFDLISSIWQMMDAFGRKEAEWLPYWRNARFVQASPDGVYVSLYRHPRNGILAVVANVSHRSTTADVRFHLSRLGLPQKNCAAGDALSARPVRVSAGSTRCRLGPLGWKLIWIKPG